MASQPFPKDFLWGTATSSYQIEGATKEDGRGSSIWDDFCATPGRIQDGSSGDVACDHYRRYKEDVALMKQLGLQAYRFSVAWPRILPAGIGAINPKGVAFYDRLVDELLTNGIRPFVTLYHWDLPSTLYAKGGWMNRDSVGWFADYATVMVKALGDRVHDWITLNEPWVSAFLGYAFGMHAPGLIDAASAVKVGHHLLLAHGMALSALRAAGDHDTRVGITLNFGPHMPATESEEDRQAAEAAFDGLYDGFATPILTGAYPKRYLDYFEQNAPQPHPDDMAIIAARNDFLGVNYYSPTRISAKAGVVRNPHAEYTLMDWEVEPEGLHQVLMQLHRDSTGKLPLYITENGASYVDKLDGGRIHDGRRVAYLKGHLTAALRAIHDGVDLHGYFVWSLMDNFEWAFGYQQFFGIVHVDFATQTRMIKDSGYFYRDVITANGVV